MPTSTVEDYLKAILQHEHARNRESPPQDDPSEENRKAGRLVTMGQIGGSLEVAPGTVTAMVKAMEKDGLVSYEPYSGVRLTESGRHTALHVLRRHRLIEVFLVEVLGLDWSEVHEEAERLEHAMSDKIIDRIDALLNFPSTDPHGDPIPDVDGRLREARLIRLADARPEQRYRVSRVFDQEEAFLRFVERQGLKPGAEITVVRYDVTADAVTVRSDQGIKTTIGSEAAAKLRLEPISENQDGEKS